MRPIVIYNMEKTRIGRWIMEGYPAKYHYPFMLFTGPKGRVSEALYKHELIHHYQVLRDGWLKFNWRYIRQLREVGYRGIDYEVEAYARMYEDLTNDEMVMLKITEDDLPNRRIDNSPFMIVDGKLVLRSV